MQTRYCDEISVRPSDCLSVCLSVRLSVTRVDCDKTEERSVQISLYHTKDNLPHFTEKKNGWWGSSLLPEILGQPAPFKAKSVQRAWRRFDGRTPAIADQPRCRVDQF